MCVFSLGFCHKSSFKVWLKDPFRFHSISRTPSSVPLAVPLSVLSGVS